jgi:signal transduction histidine kinase
MRRRLVLAIAGVATAAVALFAVPLALVLAQSYRDREQLRLQRDTVAATREVDLSRATGDPVEVPPSRDRLAVYDRAGVRMAGHGPARADALTRAALTSGRPQARSASGQLLAAVPLVVNERITGAVRAARPDAEVAEDARHAWLLLAALGAGVVAAATLAALVLARRLARPLERLAVDARRLGDGHFNVRAHRAAIPELDAVAVALDTTAQRLHDLLTRERAFSASASHQLRTPLAALRIELEGLQLKEPDQPELIAAVAQVDRLQATIDTLLTVARDLPRTDRHTDLTALLDEVQARWRGTLAEQSRPLHARIQAERPVTTAAHSVLSEILDVLIANAHRHGAGPVTLTARAVGSGLALDVTDEGPGFDRPDDIFTRRTPDREGHGLGLVLARSLAEAEGGRLTITRAAPQPTLTLHLPASTQPMASDPANAVAPR